MKSKVALRTLVLMFLICTGFASAQSIPGMVSYWRLDDGSGTTATDSVDGKHGTINGATWTTGQVGEALNFDGVDDYVALPVMDFVNRNLTFEVWFKTTNSDRQILFSLAYSVNSAQEFEVGSIAPGAYGCHYWTGSVAEQTRVSNLPYYDGEWHHFACTLDDTNNISRLYYDGVEIKNKTMSTFIHNPGVDYCSIGRNPYKNGIFYYNGTIDELAIYHRALSPEEIQQHYENGLNGLGYCELSVSSVEIDIKPGSDPNSINLKSKGVIPVVILGTDEFDAASIDGATVSFGPDGANPVHGEGHLEDVNDDDRLDWVGHFKTQDTGIKSTDVEAVISGEDFIGKDSVNIVGGSKKAPSLNPKHKLTMTWAKIKSKK